VLVLVLVLPLSPASPAAPPPTRIPLVPVEPVVPVPGPDADPALTEDDAVLSTPVSNGDESSITPGLELSIMLPLLFPPPPSPKPGPDELGEEVVPAAPPADVRLSFSRTDSTALLCET